MKDESYKTAITRKKPSNPAQWLVAHGKVLCGPNTLDYGCGRGEDAAYFKWDKYDPFYEPYLPGKRYPFIVCTYVLNVVSVATQRDVINLVKAMLLPNGVAYFTVRRDLGDRNGKPRYNTTQRTVKLKLPVVREDYSYCIYELRKGE